MLALGLRLIDRVPRFSEEQQLRRAYLLFIDGKLSAEELSNKRRLFLNQKQMDDLTCLDFARRVAEAYREIRLRHVHPEDAPAALEEGCYDLAEAFSEIDETWIKPAVDEILAAAPADKESGVDLIGMLARFRARLGRRAEVTIPAENILLDGSCVHWIPTQPTCPPIPSNRFSSSRAADSLASARSWRKTPRRDTSGAHADPGGPAAKPACAKEISSSPSTEFPPKISGRPKRLADS